MAAAGTPGRAARGRYPSLFRCLCHPRRIFDL